MNLSVQDLHSITGSTKYSKHKSAYIARLYEFGGELVEPHILAQITAQVLHESVGFRYVEEIASGKAYEGRADLGNIAFGDGVRFKGRDMIQVTGRSNYRSLTRWVNTVLGVSVDFEKHPELLTSDRWIGLGVVWYFLTRDGLLDYCRSGNIEMVTHRVNGGLNGYSDRLQWYDKTALHMLGYGSIKEAQAALGVRVDDISGPDTRAALHDALRQKYEATQSTKTQIKPVGLAAVIAAFITAIFGGKK